MNVDLFDYKLPQNLISQKLTLPRDHCNFLVYDSQNKKIYYKKFFDILDYLNKDDVLVLNNTKVFPARMIGEKQTGGKVEVFLVKPQDDKFCTNVNSKWEVLVNKKVVDGQVIVFKKRNKVILTGTILQGEKLTIDFALKGKKLWEAIYALGDMPLPPYIKDHSDQKHYQTIYAKNVGSCAAPTAGFHFTKNLLNKIEKKGIKIEYVTLNVGLGTFKPIKVDKVEDHKMDREFLSIEKSVAKRLTAYKTKGRKIVAVGTTVVRTLESIFDGKVFRDDVYSTDIFIYPGYKFKAIDKFVTNFHLPKSTPLMMTSAFVAHKQKNTEQAREEILRIYNGAIKNKFKFYSFGDSMIII